MSHFSLLNSENNSIENIYKDIKDNEILKILFKNDKIGITNCIRYYINKNIKYQRNNILHINYSHANNINYLIDINDLENINTYINFFKSNPNNVIINSLSSNIIDENINYYKIETTSNNYMLSDLDLEFKVIKKDQLDNNEKTVIQNLKNFDKYEITFNLTDKISFQIYSDNFCEITVIINSFNKSNFINKLSKATLDYNIHIEVTAKKKLNTVKYHKIIMNEIYTILKILNRTNIILRNSYKDKVLLKYSQEMFQKNSIQKVFGSRKPISVDIRAILYEIPKMYSVTDKIDGERHLLFIDGKNVLLISSNLDVKHTGISLSNDNFNKTIIDGELIIKKNKHIFMAFDILFLNKMDLRKKYNLNQRLSYLYKFMKNCLNITVNNSTNLTNMTDIKKFYSKNMDSYISELNKTIELSDNFVIWYKYYIFPKGIEENEIFIYTNLLWNKFNNNIVKLPYKLDGIIYTPINIEYIYTQNDTSKGIKQNIHEYKLKPVSNITIDFYIEFEKDNKTGKFIKIFDKTISNNYYYKCNLFVNDISNHQHHIPVPFRKDNNDHFTYIPIINNIIKDEEGTIISDKSIVEFKYKNDNPEHFRWIPLKVRSDKTETIHKFKKNYGNNMLTAYYIWEIIQNPITFEDIGILATDKYNTYVNKLKKSITSGVNNQYYEHKTGLVLPMRAFHNYIKEAIIAIYCAPYITPNYLKRKTILDIGIGRGGDLLKLYNAGIDKIVGIDIDDSSFNIPNGTYDKYKRIKSNSKSILPILSKKNLNKNIEAVFIKADASNELTVTTQEKIFSSMTNKNKELIKNHIENTKFDIINCQFTIHYMFKAEETVKNFFNNVNKSLKIHGYLLITCFDGEILDKKLTESKGTFNISYTNNKGNQVSLFNIEKIYNKNKNNFGLSVNVMNNLYSSTGKIEYLVMKNTLINYAKEFANLELVESDSFYNFYELNRQSINYIKNNNDYDDKIKSRIDNLYKFYNFESMLDQDSLEFSKLNRYYVFMKKN